MWPEELNCRHQCSSEDWILAWKNTWVRTQCSDMFTSWSHLPPLLKHPSANAPPKTPPVICFCRLNLVSKGFMKYIRRIKEIIDGGVGRGGCLRKHTCKQLGKKELELDKDYGASRPQHTDVPAMSQHICASQLWQSQGFVSATPQHRHRIPLQLRLFSPSK